MEKEMKFCQSCGMPLNDQVLGTNDDGSKNEEYCMYCYKDGKFLQDCTMDEMIEHCAQFVDEVNKGLPQPITKEEYIGQMKMYFPHLKRWRQALAVSDDTIYENVYIIRPNSDKFIITDDYVGLNNRIFRKDNVVIIKAPDEKEEYKELKRIVRRYKEVDFMEAYSYYIGKEK